MKAFFIECSTPFWETVVKELQREIDLQPVYWTGLAKFEKDIKTLQPDVIYHECTDAKRGIPAIPQNELPKVSFDAIALDIWESEAHTVYEMLTRFDFSKDYTYYDRSRYFYSKLLYWYAVIEKLKPEVVIFPSAPHMTYDYIIYCLCKRLNIKTVMFEYTGIEMYSLTMRSYEEGDIRLRDRYAEKLAAYSPEIPIMLSEKMEQFIQKARSSYDEAKPQREKDVAKKFSRHQKNTTFKKQFQKLFSVLKQDIREYRGLTSSEENNWLLTLRKQKNRSVERSFLGPFSRIQYELLLIRLRKETQKRHKFYESLTTPLDTGKPYIYVSLSGQPERSSCPQSGAFTNQMLMVHLIASCVPEGWNVYVKEHPNHFNPYMYRHAARENQMYLDYAAIPNVRLLSSSQTPFEVLDNAQAIATLTGTVGREAILRGKPVLVFGASRYRFCEGTFQIKDQASCQQAIDTIIAGYQVDHNKVRLFMQAMEEICFKGMGERLLPWFEMTNEENGIAIAQRIKLILEDTSPAQTSSSALLPEKAACTV